MNPHDGSTIVKTKAIAYWLTTSILAVAMLSGGVAELARRPDNVEGMVHLGYPLYFMRVGDEVIVLTWLDRAERDVLVVHPRGILRIHCKACSTPVLQTGQTRSDYIVCRFSQFKAQESTCAAWKLSTGPRFSI